jgi:hypothetical protein
MRVALVSRTVVLVSWLVAVLGHGVRDAPGILLAIALAAVWAAPLARDRFTVAHRAAGRVQDAVRPIMR